jgi:polypeptide N-acetylgalactosaminyltransferase
MKLGMFKCHSAGGNQEFVITRDTKEFRHLDLCIGTNRKNQIGNSVSLDSCQGKDFQKWDYFGVNIKPDGHSNLCLDSANYENKGLTVEVCNHSKTQIFTFQMKNFRLA